MSSARLSVLRSATRKFHGSLFDVSSVTPLLRRVGAYAAPRAATPLEMMDMLKTIKSSKSSIVPGLDVDYVIDSNALCEENTLLYHAARHSNLGAVGDLITYAGADVNQCNGLGEAPIHIAAHYGHRAVIELLVENCADMNTTTKPFHWTPLMFATRTNMEDVVTLLLQLGADVNKVDYFGISPLWYASSTGNLSMVMKLVEEGGANVDIRRRLDGCTAKEIAARKGHRRIVDFLSR